MKHLTLAVLWFAMAVGSSFLGLPQQMQNCMTAADLHYKQSKLEG